MNLLRSPDGRLSNLSARSEADVDGTWRAAPFPGGADPAEPVGG